MSLESQVGRPTPRWVHVWAILTVIATACLLALGGIVTTFGVGMADPVWPTTPWFLFFTSWSEPRPGFLIEHGHRLAGYIVGCFAIVLAWGMWARAKGRLRWLGIVCLMAVIIQGMLGGFRVRLNAMMGTDLAAVHGCFAQIVFSLLVSAALLTSRRPARNLIAHDREQCQWQAIALTMLVFMQLIWGALIRHNPSALVQKMHLMTAFAVVAAAIWLVRTAHSSTTSWQGLGRASTVLCIFLVLQVILGVEAWMGKFATGVLPELQKITREMAFVRTAHVLIGTGILATAVTLVLQTRQPESIQEMPAPSVPLTAEAVQSSSALVKGAHQLGGTS